MTYDELAKFDVSLVEQTAKLYQAMADGSVKEIYNKYPPEEKEVSVRYKTFGREFVFEQKVKVLNPEGNEVNARDYETEDRVKENLANFSVFLLSRCGIITSKLLTTEKKAVVYKDDQFRVRIRNWWSSSSQHSIFDCWVEMKKKRWGWKEIASCQCSINHTTKNRRASWHENWRPIDFVGWSLSDDDIGYMKILIDRMEAARIPSSEIARKEFYEMMDL